MKPKSSAPPQTTPFKLNTNLSWTILALIILCVAVIRIRLLQIPLERDEGEYAWAGQLLLQGIPPYREAFNMKFPGVYVSYAVLMAVFGKTIAGIHIGFLLVNAATIVLLFLLARRFFGPAAALASAAAYALLSLGAGIIGTSAHATHFVVLPVIAASLLLFRRDQSNRQFLTIGVLIGIAILMKQHAVFFVLFALAWLFWTRRSQFRTLALFSAGVAAPLAITGIALWIAGVFPRFWFWTFTYASQYVSQLTLSEGIAFFNASFNRVVGPNLLVWIFAAAGLLLIWWKKEDRDIAVFITSFLVCSFLAMCPGFYFREHYFVLILPPLALLVGAAFQALERLLGSLLPIGLYLLVLGFSIFEQSDFFFRLTPFQASRLMFTYNNPFPEALEIAKYLRTQVPENDRIAVLGSEPEIYFYAHRRSVTGYIYTYGMMENQPYALTMQNEMIHDVETGKPSYVVEVNGGLSWIIRPNSPSRIFDWWRAYRDQHYTRIGVADIVDQDHTNYRWGNIARAADEPGVIMEVYQKKD